jgi:hypothetical protein
MMVGVITVGEFLLPPFLRFQDAIVVRRAINLVKNDI